MSDGTFSARVPNLDEKCCHTIYKHWTVGGGPERRNVNGCQIRNDVVVKFTLYWMKIDLVCFEA